MERETTDSNKPESLRELLDDMDAAVEIGPAWSGHPRPDLELMLLRLRESKAPYKCHI